MDDRLAHVIWEDLDVVPKDVFAKAAAKSFDDGLFGGKAAGVAGVGVFMLLAVGLLFFCEEAVEKSFSGGFFYALNFDEVVAESFDGHTSTLFPFAGISSMVLQKIIRPDEVCFTDSTWTAMLSPM